MPGKTTQSDDKDKALSGPEVESQELGVRHDAEETVFAAASVKGLTGVGLERQKLEQEAHAAVNRGIDGTMMAVDREVDYSELTAGEKADLREVEAIGVAGFEGLEEEERVEAYLAYRKFREEADQEREEKAARKKEKQDKQDKKKDAKSKKEKVALPDIEKKSILTDKDLAALARVGAMTLEGLRRRYPRKEDFYAMLKKIRKSAAKARVGHKYPILKLFEYYMNYVFKMKDLDSMKKRFENTFKVPDEDLKELVNLNKLFYESDIPEEEKDKIARILHDNVLVNTSAGNIKQALRILRQQVLHRGKGKFNAPGLDGAKVITDLAFTVDPEDFRNLFQLLIHRRYFSFVKKGASAA